MLLDAAEGLAGAVDREVRDESERLGLDDPRPLVTRRRTDGGESDRIGPFFREDVPTRRLLALGRPGSGKSVSAIRLVSALPAWWTRGDPRAHHSSVRRRLAHLASTGAADIAWRQLDRRLPWAAPTCRVAAGAVLGFGLVGTAGVVPGLVAAAVVGPAAGSSRYLAYFTVTDLETPHRFDGSAPKVRAESRDFVKLLGTALLFAAGVLASPAGSSRPDWCSPSGRHWR